MGGIGLAMAMPGTAFAAQQPMQVIDVTSYGAVGDGLHDDGPAIQAALNSVTSDHGTPNVVYFPAGDYLVSSALTPHSNTMLVGTHTVDNVADLNPVSQCKIRPKAGFTGAGLIVIAPTAVGVTVRNLALAGDNVGTNLPGLKLPDSTAVSTQQGLCLEDVTIGGFSGDGIAGSVMVAALINCHLTRNQGWGINASNGNFWHDVHVTACFIYFNLQGNILFAGPGVSAQMEFVNTRIERAGGNPNNVHAPLNASAPGIRMQSARMIRLANCCTDANMGNGVEILHGSGSPAWLPNGIQFANCIFSRDGTGDQVNQGEYAALKVQGTGVNDLSVSHVTCVNCVVAPGLADDSPGATGTVGPKYGIWYENTTYFQWIGGDSGEPSTTPHFDPYKTAGTNWRPAIIDTRQGLMTAPVVAPSGAAGAPDGAFYVDGANSRLMVWVNGAWKSTILT